MFSFLYRSFARALIVIASLSLVLLSVIPPAGGSAFFIESLGDIPMMSELSVVDDSETILDLPDGRIVEIFATGTISKQAIADFYDATLPSLGWSTDDALVYNRADESLHIDVFLSDSDIITARFTLSPSQAE